MTQLLAIRVLFLCLCGVAGYEVSQVRPEFVGLSHSGLLGMGAGLFFGIMMILIDELLKSFSLRAFSAVTFGLLLGLFVAVLIDSSGLFEQADQAQRSL